MKPATARQVGYRGKNIRLFDRELNERWTLEILVACSLPRFKKRDGMTVKTRDGYRTVEGFAFCFNRGLDAGKVNKDDVYVKAISEAYKAKAITQR